MTEAREIDELRRQLKTLNEEARRLTAELEETQARSAQARALSDAEAEVDVRMEELERRLDLAAVTRHVRQALATAAIGPGPVHDAIIEGLLPDGARQAAVEAIPAGVYLPAARVGEEIAVPPRVAATHVVATWMFLNDVARDVVGPALAARIPEWDTRLESSELKLTRSAVVSSSAGARSPALPKDGEVLIVRAPLTGAAQWLVGFRWGSKAGRKRRRHGDLSSWAALDRAQSEP
jgi:hypothetical protein